MRCHVSACVYLCVSALQAPTPREPHASFVNSVDWDKLSMRSLFLTNQVGYLAPPVVLMPVSV